MTKLIHVWLTGCALCVTPVAADEGVYDGPTAIRPLTVTPKPPRSPRPTRSAISSISATRRRADPGSQLLWLPQSWPPSAPLPQSWPQSAPLRQSWPPSARLPHPNYPMNLWSRRGATACHYLPASLRMAMGSCEVQVRLEQQAGEDYASVEPPTPLAAPQVNGRRNIGCGWWPTGSDADRDCAIRGPRF